MFETPARIEPCLFEDAIPPILADLAVELQRAADDLGRGLHPESAAELADFVRVMNCYYSNLIEGHNTRLRDIEKALAGAEIDLESRPLALEARAHVVVQREIDHLHAAGELPVPTSIQFLKWVHRRFYEEMPEEFRYVELAGGRKSAIIPGVFRQTPDDDVVVGRHHPPSSQYLEAFMAYFAKRYGAAVNGPARASSPSPPPITG